MIDLASTIRAAMRQDGRSLQELAREADTTAGVLSRFARGQRGLQIDTASRLCEALGLELHSKRRRRKAR